MLVNTLNTTLTSVAKGKKNLYMNFDAIKGESTDKDHKDWIALL